MATFGKTSIGGTTDQWTSADWAVACKFTLNENSSVESMTVYMYSYGGNIRLGIYDHDAVNNRPNNLKGQTDSRYIQSTGYTWETFTFSTPINLDAGTYWLAVITDADFYSAYDAGTTNQSGGHTNAYADGFLESWGSVISYASREWSLYATYTATGALGQPYISRVQQISGMQTFNPIHALKPLIRRMP